MRRCEVAAISGAEATELGIEPTKDGESMAARSEDKRKHWESLFTMIESQKICRRIQGYHSLLITSPRRHGGEESRAPQLEGRDEEGMVPPALLQAGLVYRCNGARTSIICGSGQAKLPLAFGLFAQGQGQPIISSWRSSCMSKARNVLFILSIPKTPFGWRQRLLLAGIW